MEVAVRTDTWLKTCRKILRQVKQQVHQRLGGTNPTIKAYHQNYQREFNGLWRESSKSELITAIQDANVVLGGDFHAFHQAQRTHLRILRQVPVVRDVTLAAEFFKSESQVDLDLFLDDEISESEFLERISWEKEWGFPWSHYMPLIRLAKERKFDVIALNKKMSDRSLSSLRLRDRHAAEIIANYHLAQPDKLIYVIFGDLHLASAHLPQAIRKHLGPELKLVTVHQNSEKLYFEMAVQEKELLVNVLRQGKSKFCVLGAPPWVQWQSYQIFLEQTYDRDLDESETATETLDYTDHVHGHLVLLCEELGLRLKLDDLSVFGPGSPRVWSALVDQLSPRDLKMAGSLVEKQRSFFIPSGGVFYLSRATINHAAALAGQYLQACLSERKRVLWNMPRDFMALVWVEALAFFCSKLINPQRKPDSLQTIQSKLSTADQELREALLIALDYSTRELLWITGRPLMKKTYKPRRKIAYYESARILGTMMGERLFMAYRTNRYSKLEVVELLGINTDQKDFRDRYREVVKRLRPVPRILLGSEDRL